VSDSLESRTVRYERRDTVVWLTIDRPEQRNALNLEVIAGLRHGFERAAREPGVRALVLTGAGNKAFCAGADLKVAAAVLGQEQTKESTPYAGLLRAGMACSLPVVGRINGHCLAGGMGLLALCDLAVAADHATFGLPEVKVGIFPLQVLSILRRLVPERLLAEMSFTGEPVDALRALEAGLVNYSVPEVQLDDKVGWLLERLVDKSPNAQRCGKRAWRTIAGMPWEPALAFLEGEIAALVLTADAKEGRQAFAERRKPVWETKADRSGMNTA